MKCKWLWIKTSAKWINVFVVQILTDFTAQQTITITAIRHNSGKATSQTWLHNNFIFTIWPSVIIKLQKASTELIEYTA